MLQKLLSVLFCLLMFSVTIGQKTDASIVKPVALADEIKTATLAEVGLDKDVVEGLAEKVSSGEFPNIHSLLIYKSNALVFERYFTGKDERWGQDLGIVQHSQATLHDIRSISKSVVSACIGIAIAQGKIKSADQRVFEFFRDYSMHDTGMKKELTIKHLLTMTSGLQWNEEVPYNNPENSEIQMTRSVDPIAFILSRPMTIAAGRQWKYNGGTTQLLASIIERVSGKKVDEFARQYVFKPLGIETFEWIKFPGTNNPAAASGLRLRSRDLLKFGILYHNKGNWKNKQVIPQDWVKESFHPWVKQSPDRNAAYGYQFWISTDTLQKKPVKIIAAVGNGDQRIFFDEQNDLLVVITAGNYNLWTIKNNASALIRRLYDSFKRK